MSSGGGSSLRAILYALFANGAIAVAKGIGAFYTGSGSMLAETIHSVADCSNQLLLLLGLKRSELPPSPEHPLGYGKAIYFWSFIVAILLFSLGGLFSVYEGIHKLRDPEPLSHVWVGLIILGVSILLEAFSLYGAMREIKRMRGARSLGEWLMTSRNAELIVVFGEDVAALVGLTTAFGFLSVSALTGNPAFDAIGSIMIGVILIIIAVFVAVRVKALLIGRSADPELAGRLKSIFLTEPAIHEVLNMITLQLGPYIMLAAKIRMDKTLSIEAAAEKINAVEVKIKTEVPEIRWCFVEPDVAD